MKIKIIGLAFIFFCCFSLNSLAQEQEADHFLPIGFSLGNIEIGERIITFHRLFPLDHPESKGHVFPTATQYSRSEFEVFMHLGSLLGWNLYATLNRHPTFPSEEWQYPDFTEPPFERIKELEVIEQKDPVLPGLKAICFINRHLIAYILDTRNVSLEDRKLPRAVAGGYDLTREEFIGKLDHEIRRVNNPNAIIIYK